MSHTGGYPCYKITEKWLNGHSCDTFCTYSRRLVDSTMLGCIQPYPSSFKGIKMNRKGKLNFAKFNIGEKTILSSIFLFRTDTFKL